MNRLAGQPRADDPSSGAVPRKAGRWGELGPRLGSALVLMAAALTTTIIGGFLFDLFWLLASLGILWEWLRLLSGQRRVIRFSLGALVLAGAAYLGGTGSPLVGTVVLIGGALVLAGLSVTGSRLMSGAGLIYAGALILSVSVLRHSSIFGKDAIFFLFAVVWGTDCMAYFGGRLIGGPKLAPRFSPSKTWSGFLVGTTSGSLLGWAVSPAPGCLGCMLLLGFLGGMVAQGGDIIESIIKRQFHVKDSGTLIPGHGGLMDRLDGFIAAALAAVVLGVWRSGVDAAGAGLFQW